MAVGLCCGIWRWRRSGFLPHPTLSRWERACACRPYEVGGLQRWRRDSVGAPGRAPLPGITKPGPYHETRLPRPAYPHHSRPHPVIPAKAGIHNPPYQQAGDTGVLDSGLRRNDGEGAGLAGLVRVRAYGGGVNPPNPPFAKGGLFRGLRQRRPARIIPAPTPSFPRKRESTPRPIIRLGPAGAPDSGLRRNDGGAPSGLP